MTNGDQWKHAVERSAVFIALVLGAGACGVRGQAGLANARSLEQQPWPPRARGRRTYA